MLVNALRNLRTQVVIEAMIDIHACVLAEKLNSVLHICEWQDLLL